MSTIDLRAYKHRKSEAMTQAENINSKLKACIFCLECVDTLSADSTVFDLEEKEADEIKSTLLATVIQDLTACTHAYYNAISDMNDAFKELLLAVKESAETPTVN